MPDNLPIPIFGATVQTVFDGNVNGASAAVRTPFVFKPFAPTAVGAEVTIWTPAAGKKFRLMGYYFASDAAIRLTLRDNTAGTIILELPNLGINFLHSTPMGFGNGKLSAAVNNVLTVTGSGVGNLNGYVYGTEE